MSDFIVRPAPHWSAHQVTKDFEAALCAYTGAKYAVTTTSCTMAIQIAAAWWRNRPHEAVTIQYLELPLRVENALSLDRVETVGQLMRKTDTDLLKTPNIGRKSLREIKKALKDFFMDSGFERYFPVREMVVSIPKLSYVGVPAAVLNAGCKVAFRDEDWQGEYQLKPIQVWDSARRFTSGMFRPGAMQCVSFHWSKILGLSQGGAILHDNDEADAWLRRARFDGRTEGVDPRNDQVQYPSWHAYLSPEVSAHGLMKLSLLPKHNADLPRSDYPDLSLQEAFK